jgi:hypothetical protein
MRRRIEASPTDATPMRAVVRLVMAGCLKVRALCLH